MFTALKSSFFSFFFSVFFFLLLGVIFILESCIALIQVYVFCTLMALYLQDMHRPCKYPPLSTFHSVHKTQQNLCLNLTI
jgi:hypothetical protein